jgi:peptide-methionine (R)-S-oxide reductase
MPKIIVALFVVFGIFAFIMHNRHINYTNYVRQTGELKQAGKIIAGSYDESKLKPDAEWKKILTPKQYYILRDKGTEVPFTGELNREKRRGIYVSVGCNSAVFSSEQKYDSGTGWPSFSAPIADGALVLRLESGFADLRTEVLDKCGGHLGHVFDDPKSPSGKRYTINSAALKFIPDKEQ